MLVLEDTLSHMPEGVRYGASPPLTNNVHPLMFYTLLMSMLFFDKFGERILKGIIWLNTKESVDNKTDFES
jgi:hypothetical protein